MEATGRNWPPSSTRRDTTEKPEVPVIRRLPLDRGFLFCYYYATRYIELHNSWEGRVVPEQGPMTEAMYYILLALLKPGHGYGMMRRIRELSGDRLGMGPGTLYGGLSRMSKDGWIALTGEEGRRKNYAITDAGREALLAEYGRLKRLVADGTVLEEEQG